MPVRLQHVGAERRVARDARLGEGDLDREQGGVHPREHGDLVVRDAPVTPGRDGGHGGLCQELGLGLDDGDGAMRTEGIAEVGKVIGAPGRCGDRLGDPCRVVGEHVRGRGHDCRRASVVDLEGVRPRPGEVVLEVDQVLGGRSRVAVDDLVVVAHAEGVVGRRAQQPDQQHVGGVQVLEFVDQQVPAAGLGDAPGLGVAQEDLDGAVDLLVEVDGAGLQPEPPGRRRSRRPGRWHRVSAPRPPPARSVPAGRRTARRCRGARCRCWPGGGPRRPAAPDPSPGAPPGRPAVPARRTRCRWRSPRC